MHIYGELTKIEPQADGSIRIHGVASTGARDSSGEVVTPEAMRAALPDYLQFGAIREMHQPSAAGAALSAEVDGEGATRIAAHIVDPLAVAKVKAGVYKGLSIGGKVLSRDPADRTVITAIRLDEISLVDRPCNPQAVIDLWKLAPLRPPYAPPNAEVKARADDLAKAAGKPGRRNDFLAKARDALIAEQLERASRRVLRQAQDAPQHDEVCAINTLRHPEEPSELRGEGVSKDAAPAVQASLSGKQQGDDHLAKIAELTEEVARLAKRETDLLAEIARLRAEPLPPRTAGSHLAKAIGKAEDGADSSDVAALLAALSPTERTHLLMKAALTRPVPIGR